MDNVNNKVMAKSKIAKNSTEWWSLVKADLVDWNEEVDEDDKMNLLDYAEAVGTIYGFYWDSSEDKLVKVN